jgi:hypothetical protein
MKMDRETEATAAECAREIGAGKGPRCSSREAKQDEAELQKITSMMQPTR